MADLASSQFGTGVLPLRVKRQGREADYLSPSSAEIKNTWSFSSTPQYDLMWRCLVKHQVGIQLNRQVSYKHSERNRLILHIFCRVNTETKGYLYFKSIISIF